ncbi:MAG: sugar transferase [Bacteroidetes bacterium]|nr:sugar transferase [Bacteroidota bacterium]
MNFAYNTYGKRGLDVVLSLILIVLSLWLVGLILLAYFFTFQFPVLFKQARIGKNNTAFIMYKFRTLLDGPSDDIQKRRFWLGDLLRYFSLDEWPQLWNVLRGDMSLVGPRPLPVAYWPLMNGQQKHRHAVWPGITGWAQVNGRHAIRWDTKFELDLYYVNHISFLFDLKILLLTFGLFLFPRKDRSLEEKKFEGNQPL